jgi:hypothetical protein
LPLESREDEAAHVEAGRGFDACRGSEGFDNLIELRGGRERSEGVREGEQMAEMAEMGRDGRRRAETGDIEERGSSRWRRSKAK